MCKHCERLERGISCDMYSKYSSFELVPEQEKRDSVTCLRKTFVEGLLFSLLFCRNVLEEMFYSIIVFLPNGHMRGILCVNIVND